MRFRMQVSSETFLAEMFLRCLSPSGFWSALIGRIGSARGYAGRSWRNGVPPEFGPGATVASSNLIGNKESPAAKFAA
jgi:hypothetical protein